MKKIISILLLITSFNTSVLAQDIKDGKDDGNTRPPSKGSQEEAKGTNAFDDTEYSSPNNDEPRKPPRPKEIRPDKPKKKKNKRIRKKRTVKNNHIVISNTLMYEAAPVIQEKFDRNSIVVVSQSNKASLSNHNKYKIINEQQIDSINATISTYKIINGEFNKALKYFQGKPGVLWAQANYIYNHAQSNSKKNNTIKSSHYGLKLTGISSLMKNQKGQSVVIGLIDGSVDAKHPELVKANINQDNNFAIDDTHGTAVASILVGQNKIPGIAPRAKIISIPIFQRDDRKSTTDVFAAALDKLILNRVDIINMSFVGPQDPLIEVLIKMAAKQKIMMFAAAGNNGINSPASYPASYQAVIAVTAVDKFKQLYKQANQGNYIDFTAPGVKILVAGNHKRYGLVTGTSFATPYVTGAAALLKAKGMSNSAILKKLRAQAFDLGKPGKDKQFGNGLIQLD